MTYQQRLEAFEEARESVRRVSKVLDRLAMDVRAEAGPDVSVDDLGLSVRAHRGLMRANLLTIRAVAGVSDGDLLQIKNFGRTSLAEVKEAIGVWRAQYADRA